MRLVPLLAVLLLSTPAQAATVAESLVATLGADVAILPSADGVIAVAADGTGKTVLSAGAVSSVLVDDLAQVIWFTRPTKKGADLYLIDLTAKKAKAEKIATNVVGAVRVEHADAFLAVEGPHYEGTTVVLDAKKPALAAWNGILENWEDQVAAHEKAVKKAKLTSGGKKKLKALAKRSPTTAPAKLAWTEKVSGLSTEACEFEESEAAEDHCGAAAPITGTPYWVVLTSYSCGDGCYRDLTLYDPKKKEFFSPVAATRGATADQGAGMANARIAPGGGAYIQAGRLVSFSAGILVDVPEDQTLSGGGWLGGGAVIAE